MTLTNQKLYRQGDVQIPHNFSKGVSPTTLYAAIGNVVEFYDFALFAYLMPVITPLFFPHKNSLVSVLMAVLTFGVSFFARPLGALIFGRISDLYDRTLGFIFSLVFMIGATIGLSLLPTYESIGVWAPVGLVFLRILQALSAGGEYSGAAVLAVESSAKESYYKAGTIVVASSVMGSLLALIVANILMFFPEYPSLWRLGFALGVVNSAIAFTLRKRLRKNLQQPSIRTKTQSIMWDSHLRKIWWGVFFFAGFSGLFFYSTFTFIYIYLKTIKLWPADQTLIVNLLAMSTAIMTLLLIGPVYQKYGGRKIMLRGIGALFFVGIPSFLLILEASNFLVILLATFIFTVTMTIAQGGIHGLFVLKFPEAIRFRAYGLGYGAGLAVFGGTANFALIKLYQDTPHAMGVPIYMILVLCVATYALLRLTPKDYAPYN